MSGAFTISELKQLTSYKLGFDLEGVVVVGSVGATVFELVSYAERYGITRQLLEAVKEVRSGRGEIVKKFTAIIGSDLGGVPEAPEPLVEEVASAIEGVDQLRAGDPLVDGEVAEMHGALAKLRDTLGWLMTYRDLYHNLQTVQLSLPGFELAAPGPGGGDVEVQIREGILELMVGLHAASRPMIEALPAGSRDAEARWLAQVMKAISMATEDGRRWRCDQDIALATMIVRQELPRIAIAIRDACMTLDFGGLRELFSSIAERPGLDPAQKESYLAAGRVVAEIAKDTVWRVLRHDLWRSLSTHLAVMEQDLPRFGESPRRSFTGAFVNLLDELRKDPPSSNLDFNRLTIEFELAIRVRNPVMIEGFFNKLRIQARVELHAADLELKELVGRIAEIDVSLGALIA